MPASLKGIFLILLLFLVGGGLSFLQAYTPHSDSASPPRIVLSEKARVHILYGDQQGGGHKYGMGKACKSEFPASWDDATIIETVEQIAANDNLKWRRQDNGYMVTERNIDKVRVRVVRNRGGDNVITAYPVNTKRNPCPNRAGMPANDNLNQ